MNFNKNMFLLGCFLLAQPVLNAWCGLIYERDCKVNFRTCEGYRKTKSATFTLVKGDGIPVLPACSSPQPTLCLNLEDPEIPKTQEQIEQFLKSKGYDPFRQIPEHIVLQGELMDLESQKNKQTFEQADWWTPNNLDGKYLLYRTLAIRPGNAPSNFYNLDFASGSVATFDHPLRFFNDNLGYEKYKDTNRYLEGIILAPISGFKDLYASQADDMFNFARIGMGEKMSLRDQVCWILRSAKKGIQPLEDCVTQADFVSEVWFAPKGFKIVAHFTLSDDDTPKPSIFCEEWLQKTNLPRVIISRGQSS